MGSFKWSISFIFSLTVFKTFALVVPYNFTCSYNEQFVDNITYSLNGSVYSMECQVKPTIRLDNIFVLFSGRYKPTINAEFQVYFGLHEVKLDYCKYITGALRSMFADTFMPALRQAEQNLFHSCPLPHFLYIRDLVFPWEKLTILFKPGFYKGTFKVTKKDANRLDLLITCETLLKISKLAGRASK